MKCPPVRQGMQLALRKVAKGCFGAHKAGGHLPAFDPQPTIRLAESGHCADAAKQTLSDKRTAVRAMRKCRLCESRADASGIGAILPNYTSHGRRAEP
jgi:hypothetical protein